MDPLLDEKFILTVSNILPELTEDILKIQAVREAYGPSKNEGLCFENCTQVDFSGDLNGSLFLGLDGYTKLKLLPRIAKSFHLDPTTKSNSATIMLDFANEVSVNLIEEMQFGQYKIESKQPQNRNHKLVPIDQERFRQYILIFFLKEELEQLYLGRLYVVLLLEKFSIPRNPFRE